VHLVGLAHIHEYIALTTYFRLEILDTVVGTVSLGCVTLREASLLSTINRPAFFGGKSAGA
jgi:hypothetical protein